MTEMVSVVRVLLSCAFVCGIAWVLGRWLKRMPSFSVTSKRRLRLLEALPLGSGRSLLLVACEGRRFLLTSAPQGVQLLAEISDAGTRDEGLGMRGGSNGTGGQDPVTSEQSDGEQKTNPSHLSSLIPHPPSRWPTLPFLFTVAFLLASWFIASAQSSDANAQQQLSLGRESVQILLVLTLIVLAPFLLSVMTCFTRIVIVLSLLRLALGTPQTPPNPVVIGMALFLTLFVMAPTLHQANERGLQPFLRGEINTQQAVAEGYKPFHRFMLRQAREKDIALFLRIAKLPNPQRPDDVPAHILVPAFILSEVRTGFEIGFLLSVPFLVVDLVVASVLMGMGMLMVPPMLISLPLKLLLFVLADGWHLLMRGLALSVR